MTDEALKSLADSLKTIISNGTKIMIRYASEMNGNWFSWGQKPKAYKQSFIRFVTAIRNGIGSENVDKVAFLWAPMAGDGYPYGTNGAYSPKPADADYQDTMNQLDTNKNGILDINDDP